MLVRKRRKDSQSYKGYCRETFNLCSEAFGISCKATIHCGWLVTRKLVCKEVFGIYDADIGNSYDNATENPCLLANDIYLYHKKWG